MTTTYKNITFDHTDDNKDFTGSMQFSLKMSDFLEYYDYNDQVLNYFTPEDEGMDEENWKDEKEFTCGNADLFITMIAWMIKQDRKFEVEYYGKVFWLFHDIGHAENDCIGDTVYPSAFGENRANQFSLDQMKERNIEFDLSYEEVESFKDEFQARFNEPEIALDIEELFYSLEEDY